MEKFMQQFKICNGAILPIYDKIAAERPDWILSKRPTEAWCFKINIANQPAFSHISVSFPPDSGCIETMLFLIVPEFM